MYELTLWLHSIMITDFDSDLKERCAAGENESKRPKLAR